MCLSGGLAALFRWAEVPAALLLGPMVAAMGFALFGARIRMPRWSLVGAQAIIGCLVARLVTSGLVTTVANDWLVMLLAVLTTVLAGAVVGWVLMRFGNLPGMTAAWGSVPGAASTMVSMAEEFGADPRLVAFMQYFRLILVVGSASLVSRQLLGAPAVAALAPSAVVLATPLVPLVVTLAIAGSAMWLARRIRFPTCAILLPAVLGGFLQASGTMAVTLPPWLPEIAYGLIGWYVGLSFNRQIALHALKAIPQLMFSTFGLIALCAGSAWMLTWLLKVDGLTAYLATTPGGIDSVTVIAAGSQADVPFVLAIQTMRLFIVLAIGPALAKLIAGMGARRLAVDGIGSDGFAG